MNNFVAIQSVIISLKTFLYPPHLFQNCSYENQQYQIPDPPLLLLNHYFLLCIITFFSKDLNRISLECFSSTFFHAPPS